MKAGRASTAIISFLVSIPFLSACGSQDVRLPNVTGMPLDEAHQKLEKLGFDEFVDSDAFEDRAIMLDANWVVVEQRPAAGQAVDADASISLGVGKRDDKRAIDRIAADSPVAQEFAEAQKREQERQAAAAASQAVEEQKAAATRVTLRKTYINDLDARVRLGSQLFSQVDDLARDVRANTYGDEQSLVVMSAVSAAEALTTQIGLHEPPVGSRLAGTHRDLVGAAQRLEDAARTLASAEGTMRSSSLARYADVRGEAGQAWNTALTRLYEESGVEAPLLH